MTIPFHRDGVNLFVTEPLLVLLNQEVAKYDGLPSAFATLTINLKVVGSIRSKSS